MKEKLALVIAALMITSIALSISSTSVTASLGISISPATVGGDRYVILTLSVTNDTGDNIARILLRQASWVDPMGGADNVLTQWENVADNLTKAGTELAYVVENLKIAAENAKASGPYFENFGREIYEAGTDLGLLTTAKVVDPKPVYTYIRDKMHEAKPYLERVRTLIGTEPLNLTAIKENLKEAGTRIRVAGENMKEENKEFSGYDNIAFAGENLAIAGAKIENAAENYLAFGNFGTAASLISDAVSAVNKAALNLKDSDAPTAARDAGADLDEADDFLSGAATKLAAAGTRLVGAGSKLSTIKALYLDNAENLIKRSTGMIDNLTYLGARFLENIGEAATALSTENNIPRAGDNLKEAATALDAVQTAALLEFGSAYLGTRPDSADNKIAKAGDNLSTATSVNLTVAASNLEDAAAKFKEAATKLKATKAKIKPAHWMVTAPLPNDVRLDAENRDYYLAPGASRDFVFLWKSPSTSGEYTVELWTYDNVAGTYVTTSYTTLKITVDITKPSLVIKVTQAGVEVDNLVGKVYQGGKATITITASEVLSDLGTVYVDNVDNPAENLLPPISMAGLTTKDNKVFTYEFPVGTWDAYSVGYKLEVRIPYSVDLYGNENSTAAHCYFITDTRAPIFIDNRLDELLAEFENKAQAGTGKAYYVDNVTKHTLSQIRVEDNWTAGAGIRFGYENYKVKVVKVWVDTVKATPTAEDNFSATITMSEGLNAIVIVKAVDWTGNEKSDNLESLFIDTKKATAAFVSISGLSASKLATQDNRINDNTPSFVVSLTDPGYPSTGLGIFRENVLIRLIRENDSYLENANMENTIAWTVGGGDWTTEHKTALAGERWYRLEVRVNDNFHENFMDNVVRFYVDVTPPGRPTLDVTVSKNIDAPTVLKTTSRTITGFAEVGATVKVYGTVDTRETVMGTATVGTDGKWAVTITLTAGKTTKIEVSATDVAGNEGSREIYGYLLADATAPTVTITAPTTGTTTDAASIILEATVTKDTWETYAELTVRIDATSFTAPVTATNALTTAGKLARAIGLVEGTNTISVSAMDAAGNWSAVATVTVTRTVTPLATYAIIVVIVALVLAAIAIFRKR